MILVTAFEPFGGEALNPTQMILEALPDTAGGCGIRKLLLPVEFKKAREMACAEYDRLSPAADEGQRSVGDGGDHVPLPVQKNGDFFL